MGIYVLNSHFIQHVLGICHFAWNSPYKDHIREIWQIRGLIVPLLNSKLTHEELNSISFNISLQEGHSLIFADHTEIVFTISWFTAMLLSTICILKMCNFFHFQIQSNIETLPLSLSSLTSPASKAWFRSRVRGKKTHTTATTTIHLS